MHSAQLTIDNSSDFKRFFLQAKDEYTGLIVYACSREEAFRISEKTDDAPGLYILQATDSTLYVGQSKDLAGRIRRHLQADKISFERIFVMAKDPSFAMYLDYAEAKLFTMMEDLGLKLEQSNLRGSLPKKEKRLFETSAGRVHAANSWLSQFLSYCIAFGLREPGLLSVVDTSLHPTSTTENDVQSEREKSSKVRAEPQSIDNSAQSQVAEGSVRSKERQTPLKLSVTFPDGTIIQHPKASLTLVEVLTVVGLDAVAPLKIPCSGRFLVEKTSSPHIRNHVFVGDFRVITHSSSAEKVAMLNKISDALNLRLEVNLLETQGK